jgi:hypothetical protein
MVISTGLGPGVRFTVEVETPQPWRLNATQPIGVMARETLRMGSFMDTAGTLNEGAFSPRHTRLGSRLQPTDVAQVVALCPLRLRKERTLTKRLDVSLKCGQGGIR